MPNWKAHNLIFVFVAFNPLQHGSTKIGLGCERKKRQGCLVFTNGDFSTAGLLETAWSEHLSQPYKLNDT